jgi:hypothetical protein
MYRIVIVDRFNMEGYSDSLSNLISVPGLCKSLWILLHSNRLKTCLKIFPPVMASLWHEEGGKPRSFNITQILERIST